MMLTTNNANQSAVAAIPAFETEVFAELDAVQNELAESFRRLPDFRELEIPMEFRRIVGNYGTKELTWTAWAFRARGIGYGRVVRIVGNGTWINNIIVFAEDGYTLPVLGIEVLAFREKIHLLVADLFPLCAGDEGLMDDISETFADLGETPKMPEWATKIFSRSPIFRKPASAEAIPRAAQAMRDVSATWLAKTHSAMPEKNAEIHTNAQQKRDAYILSHAEDEPANPFLGRAFGSELGKRLVEEFLFPTENWNKIRGEFNG
jgi:Ferredoxin-dependent bilin reductase